MKTVLKLLLAVCIIAVGSPAFALFTNGGFESGDLSGWTILSGNSYNGTKTIPQALISPSDYYAPQVISNGSPGQDSVHYPYLPSVYNGTYMAVLNDAVGDYHATELKQTDTVTAADIAAGGVISVNWGTVLDDPGHIASEQPYFEIDVLKNGTNVATFSADASAHSTPGSGWTNVGTYAGSGDSLWYKAGQFTLPMSGFSLGDSVTVELSVYDCGLGGHGGYAFLDGIQSGTPPPPPPGVPEPATMLLLGFGLVGLAGLRRRFTK